MNTVINNLKGSIAGYAKVRKLSNTERAIEYVENALNKLNDSEMHLQRKENAFLHIYEVCSMIIDLELPITDDEEDSLLAAIMIHVLHENWPVEDLYDKLVNQLGYNEETYNIVNRIAYQGDMSDDEQQAFCERIQSDRLSLIAALAHRGNIIERMYQHTTWVAHTYIAESKALYLPMAIYGKEHYRELLGPISILTEKLKILLEVAEVFIKKYEVREAELTQDILALHEENATIRGIIADFKAGK